MAWESGAALCASSCSMDSDETRTSHTDLIDLWSSPMNLIPLGTPRSCPGSDSSVLQACDITGGLYLKVPQMPSLLQYLLWVFLPDQDQRSQLILPPPIHVDYRAACFCHRSLIEIGYVCSVCLSIFCNFSPICTTCETAFKISLPPVLKAKKKKQKVSL